MKFSEYPFLRYAVFFIFGILLYPYFGFLGLSGLACLTLGFFLVYLILSIIDVSRQVYRFKTLFPILAYALLICMGLLFTYLKDATNDVSHLVHHQKI